MSVAEKERRGRVEKRTREPSVSGRRKGEEGGERGAVVSQEKEKAKAKAKAKAGGSVKERGKSEGERGGGEKGWARKGERREKGGAEGGDVKEGGRTKRLQSVGGKIAKDRKIDALYVKDLLEKRGMRREGERGGKGVAEGEGGRREEEGRRAKSRRDRTRTRTLSPTEVKQLLPSKAAYEMAAGDASAEAEAEGKEERRRAEEEGGEEEYEEDFEEYASDFEEGSEEEEVGRRCGAEGGDAEVRGRESPEVDPWRRSIRKQELEAVKKWMEKEKEKEKEEEEVGGEERGRAQVIDFSKASKRLKETKRTSARRRRGEELLSMISLDAISYSVLEIPAVPYEEFMRVFGKANTKQAMVQTNEDDLEEEVQTDETSVSSKWTQSPAECVGRGGKESLVLRREERLGVGGDVPSGEEVVVQWESKALWSFLSWAGQVVLSALERKSGSFLSVESLPNHSKAMAFGDGFVRLNVGEIPFLKGRAVRLLCVLSGRLLSVHVNKEKSFQKCMVCVWSLRELSKPLRILKASNRVSCCCFGLNQGNLVFAGLSDGSLCLWDLREPSAYHSPTPTSPHWTLHSPTYTTACDLTPPAHRSPIVAVRLLTQPDHTATSRDFTPTQICSLDNDGTITIWTVVQLEKPLRTAPSDDLGLAPWGRVKLVRRSTFSVFASLREELPGLFITCNDILVNDPEDDGFYVANSLGSVHHCSAYGAPMTPRFYVPAKQDAIVQATCLELCPFSGNYFLAGCGDGSIRLHSRHHETPLICLNAAVPGEGPAAAVVSITWMRTRPCVFFALDSLSRINVWDLGVSDMYPEVSLELTDKKITCMRLLPASDPRQVPFIAIGTEGGGIEVHKLKKEYGCRSASDVQNEMKMFLKYVSIL